MIIPVLLAGGVGSRLWPLSRELYPKQCLNLVDDDLSLVQQTAIRAQKAVSSSSPIVVCNEEHRFLIAQQISEVGIKADILLEPEGKNTAPAIALAAFQALKRDANAIVVVLPADHVIQNIDSFSSSVSKAIQEAENDFVVTFGVEPTYAETGYGYIQANDRDDISSIAAFKEKPDLETAQRYLNEGGYYWNSGMFVFKAQIYLEELKLHNQRMHESAKESFNNANKDLDFVRIDAGAFAKCPADSIDYAVMEKTRKGKVVAYRGDWNDIGAWSALYDLSEKDSKGNVLKGDVLLHDASNNLIRAESRLVAAVGVEGLAIIETADAVTVVPKDRAQDVKEIVEKIKAEGRLEHNSHVKVYRPWGTYQGVDKGERHQVKNIRVKPGEKLSVQMHHHRAEHWIVVRGTAKVKIGDVERIVSENESVFIPIGEVHSLENPGKIPLELIEVQTGSYLGEDDIVRFTDRYGRS